MQAKLISVQALNSSDRQAMYTLLETYFEGVQREVFEADLSRKNWVILLKDETGSLQGFSSLLLYQTTFREELLSVVYSGDTIVDPAAWSSSILARSWLNSIRQLRHAYPQGRLYWLLISSGYRTYRFLPLFAKEFYPRFDQPTPPAFQSLKNHLARELFGEGYDEQTGIVRFPHPQRLKAGLQGIPAERLKDPHIQFFNTHNPGHEQGDELVCLTEVCEANLTPAGQRLWGSRALTTI